MPGGRDQAARPELARDDPHPRRIPAISAPNRSSAASSSTGSPPALEQLAGVGAGLLQQIAVARQPRVPEVAAAALQLAQQVALAAHVEVDLGQVEAARVLDQRLQAAGAVLGRLGRLVQEAVRLLRPAPDPAAQLVQLGEPEPVGVLDHHHGGVRHVDADLDHRRRDQHAEVAGREPAHPLGPVGGLHLPVDEVDRDRLQRAGRKTRGLRLGGARLDRDRALDERADDVRLPAGLHLLDDPAGSRRRASTPGRPREHRVRPGGSSSSTVTSRSPYSVSASERGIGVAVMCSTCGVAPPPSASRWSTPNRCCSSITATSRRLNVGVQQRVRADRDQRLAGRDPLPARVELLLRHVAGEERRARRRGRPAAARRSSRCCTASTSVGAISARLAARLEGPQQHASATAVLPEPTSPCSRRCIGSVASRSAPISSSARRCAPVSANGRPRDVARHQVARAAAAPRPGRRRRRGAVAQQRDLQQQQLLVGQPVARRRGALGRARPVAGVDGVAAQRQPVAHPQRRRQRVADAGDAGQRRARQVAQRARRDLRRRVVDGREAEHRAGLAAVGLLGRGDDLERLHRDLRRPGDGAHLAPHQQRMPGSSVRSR